MSIDSVSYDIGNNAENNAQIALANARPYKPSNSYTAGDWCTYDDKIYSANVSYISGTTGFNAAKWSLIGETNNVLFVDNLPTSLIDTTTVYVLKADCSLNMHDGTIWHTAQSGATTQIQSDWNQVDNSKADFINNKPTNVVSDVSYVHTDTNYTTAEKIKVSNQSGVNTGDEIQATIKTKLGIASNTVDGYLTSVDWGKFNSKQNAIYLQTTQPTTPISKDIWINNTSSPYAISIYNGIAFIPVGSTGSESGAGGTTISAWVSGTNYVVGTLVIESNNIFQCTIANNNTIFTIENWNLISSGIVNDASTTQKGVIELANDLSGTALLPSVTGINSIHVDDMTRNVNSNFLAYNPTSKNYEHYGINVGNIINSSGDIVQPVGSPISISQGQEVIVNHTEVTNDKIMIQVLEQIPGITSSDMTTNFNTASNYIQEDSTKTIIGGGSASLLGTVDTNTVLLLHMEGVNGAQVFTDSSSSPNVITSHGSIQTNTTTYIIGSSSAKFNGTTDYLSLPNSVCSFGVNDFTISANIKVPTQSTTYPILLGNSLTSSSTFNGIYISDADVSGFLSIRNGSTAKILKSTKRVDDGNWHNIVVQRKSGVLQILIDGILNSSIAYLGVINWTALTNINIGYDGVQTATFLNGYIDEMRITKGVGLYPASFTPAIVPYNVNSRPTTPTYLTTKLTSLSLSSISLISSLTMSQTLPTNTSIKILVSFDGRKNWLYYVSGNGWNLATTGVNLASTSFTNSNVYTDIQTYFTNLTIAQITTDLSTLGIMPVQLDFCWLLGTTDPTVTPSLGIVTIGYTSIEMNEEATVGRYAGTNCDYGLRRVSSTQSNIKKLSTGTANITLNLIIGV